MSVVSIGLNLAKSVFVVGKGIRKVDELRRRMDKLEPELLPDEARAAIGCLFDHIDGLGIDAVEARVIAWHKSSEVSQRLASAPSVGPMTATALVAAVGDGKQFQRPGTSPPGWD